MKFGRKIRQFGLKCW